MINVTIKTNGRRRPVLEWHELTAKEREEFDYLMRDDARAEMAKFFRYKDMVFDLGDMMTWPTVGEWLWYHNFTAWNGIVVKYARDGWLDRDTTAVIVGTYTS